MATVVAPMTVTSSPAPETVADVIDALGVPPSRIRWNPRPGTATEADVLTTRAESDLICELVDGILVEKGMSYRASLLGSKLLRLIGDFVERTNLGLVTGEAGMMRLMAGLIRIPDVAFVPWSRIPGAAVPDEPIPGLVPSLVVEVLGPSNTAKEMARKRREYFEVGVELVWVVDPATRTVEVFTGPDQSTRVDESQALTGGGVLPGLHVALADVFAELDRRPPA